MADVLLLQMARCGSVRLNFIANDAEATVTITDVYLASHLAKSIMSYRKLEGNGFALVYDEVKRSLARPAQ